MGRDDFSLGDRSGSDFYFVSHDDDISDKTFVGEPFLASTENEYDFDYISSDVYVDPYGYTGYQDQYLVFNREGPGLMTRRWGTGTGL